LNRFKSGFFADSFVNTSYSDIQNPQFNSFIFKNEGILSCTPLTRHLDLQLGSESISGFTTTYNPNVDHSFVSDLGSPGIRKTGDVVTLNYSEVEYISQPYANIETNVSGVPIIYNGTATLTPSEDIWQEERIIERNTFVEGETTVKDIKTVIDRTNIVNKRGPDIIRYVDRPKVVSTRPTPSNSSSSSSSGRRYEGIATGNVLDPRSISVLGFTFGTVNQNAGFSQSNTYTSAIGKDGLLKAEMDGYSVEEVQEWVNRVGAVVGRDALSMGLRPAPGAR